jgi:cytochrome c553
MKTKISIAVGTLLLLAFCYGMTVAQDAPKDGKTIFTDAKCNNCHAITAEKIEALRKPMGKMLPPDLSDVGTRIKADFIAKYITKDEKLNDKTHPIAFKGTDDELKVLAAWLETLKTVPEPPKEEPK